LREEEKPRLRVAKKRKERNLRANARAKISDLKTRTALLNPEPLSERERERVATPRGREIGSLSLNPQLVVRARFVLFQKLFVVRGKYLTR